MQSGRAPVCDIPHGADNELPQKVSWHKCGSLHLSFAQGKHRAQPS